MGARGPRPRPADQRFGRFVEKAADGCWNWTGAIQEPGYGRFSAGPGVRVLAHRWSYEHHVGPIPDGLTIDHLCLNKACVNPDHLEPVTREENALRANRNVGKTHCIRGHEFTEDNIYAPPSRPHVRACRTCRKAAADERKAA